LHLTWPAFGFSWVLGSRAGLAGEVGCSAVKEEVVSKPHLQALEEALLRKGWRVIAVHAGDDYRISATWEIQRSSRQACLFIDFDGMDDMVCLPLEDNYGCHIRGKSAKDETARLYFRRPNKSRSLWEQDLAAFVLALDNDGNADPAALDD
jgi:hypothetical protein